MRVQAFRAGLSQSSSAGSVAAVPQETNLRSDLPNFNQTQCLLFYRLLNFLIPLLVCLDLEGELNISTSLYLFFRVDIFYFSSFSVEK